MKQEAINFNDYPFMVPTEKRMINKLEGLVQDLEETGSIRTGALALKHWNKYLDEITTQFAVIATSYTLDTTNKAYINAQARMDELTPILASYQHKVNKFLSKCKYRKDLEKEYGTYYFKKLDASLKAFDDKIVNDLVEENKLVSQYDNVMGSAKISFNGETYNISQLSKFMEDKDHEVRKAAAIAYDNWLNEHNEELGAIYDKLVHLRHNMATKLGFKKFTDLGYLRLGRTDYTAKDVKLYREQIATEVVPIAEKLFKKQVKNLGVKHPEFFDYNVYFTTGNPVPAGDAKFILDTAKKMYATISPETKEFFDFMVKNELLDLETRPGKAPGGYTTEFPLYKSPFIFSNFNGTSGDVDVLTHEGGHAFQSYIAFKSIKVPEYRVATLETCEIHSMSMEFLAYPYAKKFFGKDENKYLYQHLVSSITFLPYGITVDEFQHWVYDNPNATHEERCAKWKEIESKYTPHKTYQSCPTLAKGTWWLKQGHIFSSPFYYIDYTLAQVVAFQFLAESKKNYAKAWKKYFKLVKCAGKYPFTEALAKNSLRNPFTDGNVKKTMSAVNKIVKGFDVASL